MPLPYFKPVWFPDIVGLRIDDDTDWDEVGELLTESYCTRAPKRLVALVDRPGERDLECPEEDSNLYAPEGAGGFKPPASAVPPPGPGRSG